MGRSCSKGNGTTKYDVYGIIVSPAAVLKASKSSWEKKKSSIKPVRTSGSEVVIIWAFVTSRPNDANF